MSDEHLDQAAFERADRADQEPTPDEVQPANGMTVRELIAVLEAWPDKDMKVWSEGCDCDAPVAALDSGIPLEGGTYAYLRRPPGW